MKLNKNHIILACAILVLILVLVYRGLNPVRQKEVEHLTYGPASGSVSKQARQDPGPGTDVGLSEERRGKTGFDKAVHRYFTENKHSGDTRKNLFMAGTNSAIIKTTPPQKTPVKQVVEPVIKPLEPQKDPVQEAKTGLAQYQLYGSYEVGGTRAVFLGQDKMVFIARAGDRIEGKYLIHEIGATEITLQALDINKTFQFDLEAFGNKDDE